MIYAYRLYSGTRAMNVEKDDGGFITFRDAPFRAENAEPAAQIDAEWIDYCRSREFAERAAAKHATCTRSRKVHQQLAQAYSRMIRGGCGK